MKKPIKQKYDDLQRFIDFLNSYQIDGASKRFEIRLNREDNRTIFFSTMENRAPKPGTVIHVHGILFRCGAINYGRWFEKDKCYWHSFDA